MAKTVSNKETVVVGCKIPSGLCLQLRDRENPGIVIAEQKVKGSAIDMKPYVREFGIGLTRVDKEFWDAWASWAKENKYKPFIEGHVFAHEDREYVEAEGEEKLKLKTSLEALDPNDKNDSRMNEFRAAKLNKFDENSKE